MKLLLILFLAITTLKGVHGWKAIPVPREESSRRLGHTHESDSSDDYGCDDYVQLVSEDAHARSCIVVKEGKPDTGQRLILGDCDQANQCWRYDDDGLYHSKLDDGMCMQAGHDDDQPEVGTELRLKPCDSQDPLQVFNRNHQDNHIELVTPDVLYCVAFRGAHSQINSDPIVLKRCDESHGTDGWVKEDCVCHPPSSDDFECDNYVQLVSEDAHARSCIIVKDGKPDVGQRLILGACDQVNQSWSYDDDGLYHSKLDDGMCMQAGHDGDPPQTGAKLRLKPCDRHHPLQGFNHNHQDNHIELVTPDVLYCVAFKGDHSQINSDPIVLKRCDESHGTDEWVKEDCDPVPSFIEDTFVEPLTPISEEEVVTTEGGMDYDVKIEATFYPDGVVSLFGASDNVNGVTCDLETEDNATILIEMADGFDCFKDAKQLFPESAMLVVAGDEFGSCDLGTNGGNTADDSPADGYLIILSVTCEEQNPSLYAVQGSVVSSLLVFDEVEMSYTAIEADDGGEKELVEFGSPINNTCWDVTGLKICLDLDPKLWASVKEATAHASLQDGLTMKVVYGYGASFDLNLTLDFDGGNLFSEKGSIELFPSVTIYGLPAPSSLRRVLGVRKGLGVFFNMPLFYEYGFELPESFSRKLNASLTEEKEFEFTIQGGWGGLDIGNRVLKDVSIWNPPDFESLDLVPDEVKFEFFTGLQPEVEATLFGVASTAFGVRAGPKFIAAATAEPYRFDPTTDDGICSNCHYARLNGSLVAEPFLRYQVDIKIKWGCVIFVGCAVNERFRRSEFEVFEDLTVAFPFLEECFLPTDCDPDSEAPPIAIPEVMLNCSRCFEPCQAGTKCCGFALQRNVCPDLKGCDYNACLPNYCRTPLWPTMLCA